MNIIRFDPLHFSHLHQSLCSLTGMNTYDAKALCYVLYAANQDTFHEVSGCRRYQQINLGDFLNIIDHAPYRPYRTIVQLYRSLEALLDAVKLCYLIEQDRIYLTRIDEHMAHLENQFLEQYGTEISGPDSVYSLCSHHLVPYVCEPQSCLIKDHLNDQDNRSNQDFCRLCRANTISCDENPLADQFAGENADDPESLQIVIKGQRTH
jgi:hypothetical protein